MIRAPFLKKGDAVTLISTARKINREEIQAAVTTLESWGLEVRFGKHLFEADHQFAGSDLQRTYDLQAALDDTSIAAIICVRGGYGTVRIIDNIDFSIFQKHPKWVCGFSDVTVLHSAIHQLGICSIHSTMPLLFSKEEQQEAVESLRKTLFGEPFHYHFPIHSLNRGEAMKGVVVGGNLSILANLIGTTTQIDTRGKILFLEDLDEYLYHIDRMMMQLKRSGMLSNLAGLLVGHMSDMKDNAVPFGKNAYEIIFDVVKAYNYPVFFDFPAGHLPHNLALVFGQHISINKSASDFFLVEKS